MEKNKLMVYDRQLALAEFNQLKYSKVRTLEELVSSEIKLTTTDSY